MYRTRILLVDDDPQVFACLQSFVEAGSCELLTAASGAEAIERLRHEPLPDLVLLDLAAPEVDGLRVLPILVQECSWLKVVVLCSEGDVKRIVRAVRLGAQDYLAKPLQSMDVEALLNEHAAPSTSGADASNVEVEEVGEGQFFLAASPAMRQVHLDAERVAGVDVPLLMLGRTGTGKEVVARLIHKLSPRSANTFLKVNCAALPAELLESELFGYETGAFTGATRPKPGKFELCKKGTIFLDEIAEIPPALQAKLLHVLQDGEFARLGGRRTIKVDVRVIAATNVDVQSAIAEKKLREDLYYRLSGFVFHLPPLRNRREDIPVLLRHFLKQFAVRFKVPEPHLSETLWDTCLSYDWPGNVRELESFAKRYLVLGERTSLPRDLAASRNGGSASAKGAQTAVEAPVEDLKMMVRSLVDDAEQKAIRSALESTQWNRKKAAALLNISYKALLDKIRRHSLDRPAQGVVEAYPEQARAKLA